MWDSALGERGRWGCRNIRQQTFPYPVFGRFSYILSALGGLTFLVFAGFAWCKLWMLVRQYQTGCTRTAGHWISEKPKGRFRLSLSELFGGGRLLYFLVGVFVVQHW